MNGGPNSDITFGINPFEAGGMEGDGLMMDDSSEQGLGESVLPGFCQANTELLNNDQRAQCGLPTALSQSEQVALRNHDAALRNQQAAAASAATAAASRTKKIKIVAGVVGLATAGYFFYKWYQGREHAQHSIFSLAGIKETLGWKSNPVKKRQRASGLSRAPRCSDCGKVYFESGRRVGRCLTCSPKVKRKNPSFAPVVKRKRRKKRNCLVDECENTCGGKDAYCAEHLDAITNDDEEDDEDNDNDENDDDASDTDDSSESEAAASDEGEDD